MNIMAKDLVLSLNGQDVSKILECGICEDKLTNPRVFGKCQHMFCWGCIELHIEYLIEKWAAEITCPLCRCSLEKSSDYFKSTPKGKWEESFSKNFIVSEIMSVSSIATAEDNNCQVHITQMYRHFCRDHGEFICGDCLREKHLNGCRVLSLVESEQICRDMVENEICQLQVERNEGMREFETFCDKIYSSINNLKQCRDNLDKVINTLDNKQRMAKEENDRHFANFGEEITNTETQLKSSKTIFELKKCYYEVAKSKGNFANLRTKVLEHVDMEETISTLTSTIATINDLPKLLKKPLGRDKNEGNAESTCDCVGGRKGKKERNQANDETDKTPNGTNGPKRSIKKKAGGRITEQPNKVTTNGYLNLNKKEAFVDNNGGQRHDDPSDQLNRPPPAWHEEQSSPSKRNFGLGRAKTALGAKRYDHIKYEQIEHTPPRGNSYTNYSAVTPRNKPLPPINHKP